MKIALYTENLKLLAKSGVGKAITHQKEALSLQGITYSTDVTEEDYDVLHLNTVGPMSLLRAKRAKAKGKKVIFHAHTTEEDFRNSFILSNQIAGIFKRWLVYCYSQSHTLITPSPYSRSLLENYGLKQPIHAISNGIKLEKFVKDPSLGDAFREEYGFTKDDKIILSVGLTIKRKGILDFIELAKRMPDHQFVWCGYTSPIVLPAYIKKAIKNAPKNAHFVGYVTNIRGGYNACDAFFMPTYEETEGIVVLEALACKTPVVIRDIPVYNEWLEDGVNCFKGDDNATFENLLRKVCDNELPDTTELGYEVARERSLHSVGEMLGSVYTDLTAG